MRRNYDVVWFFDDLSAVNKPLNNDQQPIQMLTELMCRHHIAFY